MKNFSDSQILHHAKTLVAKEREATLQVLECLAEIETRKLHLERGYSSLHEFTVKELGYSDSAAARRIASMRLMRSVPEAKPMLASGELSLSNASQVQTYFKINRVVRPELVREMAGKSSRECERKLAELSPLPLVRERTKALTATHTEVRLVLTQDTMAKLEQLKELTHSKDASLSTLIEKMADMLLKASTPRPRGTRKSQQTPNTRTPSPALKREVFRQSDKRCTYTDPKTQRRCEATHYLQYDHILSYAHNGETTAPNLQLLCSAHNRLKALQLLGEWSSYKRRGIACRVDKLEVAI